MRPEGHWTHYGNQIELGYRPILTIDPIKAKTIGTTTDFSYTGSYQEYIAKDNGYYKLECWGAQGAGSHQDGELGYAGRGGYSVGQLYLEKDEKLYVYVGGQGNARNSAGTVAGGYNGGGYGWKNTGGSRNPGASGGGATDIRLKSGEWNNQEGLLSRIIVAGGGGGGGMDGETAGAGGGTSGGNGYASGGTQTSGYKFGYGADATTSNGSDSTYGGPGAGGGWYGGKISSWRGAGGGSGFVLNENTVANTPAGYSPTSKYYLDNSITIDGNSSMPSTLSGTEQGHAGNGYARITFLGRTIE